MPLGVDGATITRYSKSAIADGGVKGESTIAFDWNRPGEPKNGGGSGQGFLRLRSIDNRLFVPDADPPHDGFGILDHGTEGYVFVSDHDGHFAKPTGDHFHPPAFPTADRAGAGVIPRAYHDLDVISFRGQLYASTGSVPPKERAWTGPSPGALHVANADRSKWVYQIGYPADATHDVWRLTFMTRFRDRLYVGIQEYYPREMNDYVVFSPPPESKELAVLDMHPTQVTSLGGAETLRWYTDRGSLYWITIDKDGTGKLRVTTDGLTWTAMDIPPEAGRPADVVRMGDDVVLLTERRLYTLDSSTLAISEIASWTDPKLFAGDDFFCAAPLAVFDGDLYAGSQKDGSLMRFVAD